MNKPQIDTAKEPTASQRTLVLTPLQDLSGFLAHHIGRATLFAVACSSVVAVLLIFLFVIKEALPFLQTHSIGDLFSSSAWYPEADEPKFGILALLTGSVYVTVAAIMIAVPIGITVAVFLSDITSMRVRNYIKPVIEILAAIPSVAYGFFAVLVLAPWMQNSWSFSTGTNALNAAIVLSIMALPTIISVAEDAISAVGRDLREASYGLGATRFETIFKVVLPAANSGIVAAVILGVMRAIGETMVVWMASGNANQIPSPWWDLSQSVRTMTATIAGEMGETPKDTNHYHSLFFVGVTLLVMTFMLNLVSEYFLASAKKKTGK
ncbi:MAG: phosphate ABC transporter permease subunit PstC [Anaerohalosphaeraceae bacterium]|nr:phosphate ABC transporter permease subunit PstC [Anaerohalosphaeraceae bacterium]